MIKHLLTILLLALSFQGYTQILQRKVNTMSVSVPVIWNKSEGTYYSLGNRRIPQGSAVSYGLNIAYSKPLYKNLFGIVGIGYFRQAFGIIRPFNYITPDSTKPLVYTRKYTYNSIMFNIGIGYRIKLNSSASIKTTVSYNIFNSYRQKYNPDNYFVNIKQLNNKSIVIGNVIQLTAGAEMKLTNKISAGIDMILPVSTRWNDDKIFFKLGYANDEQQMARTKSSYGAAITCNYRFYH